MKIGGVWIGSDDMWAVLFILFVVITLGTVVTVGVTNARTKAACLQAGFPGFRVAWNLEQYCVKRVDQTDVVVPFAKRDGRE